jgi:hypothetical protein
VALALDPLGAAPPCPPEGGETILALRRLYSMEAERAIHDALFPDLAPPMAAPVTEDDDFLFG